jgi:hypothetical protein
VHGVLTAKVKRRILSVAAVFAVPAMMTPAIMVLASPAQAGPARPAATGRVLVTISSMNPQYATPGATVNLIGTVTNGTRQTAAGLEVQLATSSTPFPTRDNMDSYLANGEVSGLVPAGRPFLLPASVAPGATASWSASFQVGTQGISAFGVYPVAAQLQDSFTGELLASGQTLLPFWPGQQAAGLKAPLNISWLWPLIDQPHHQACTALTNNDLTTSLSPGGRLSTLLSAGISHAGADLTWVVDPALLSDVATMTKPYPVGGSSSSCTGAPAQPASRAAARWLSSVKTVTSGQPTVITPYADVDMTALVQQGLNADLASAYRTGDAVARSVLGRVFKPTIAWPAGGTADLSVLTSLAATEHVGTVVLNSSEMPPSDTVFHPDDAVTSIPAAGTTMNVLLADDTLTSVLRAGNTNSGTLPRSAEFAVKQRFLAETAMIVAEAPGSTRSVVVAPPAGWSPSQQLASDLLGETVGAPWLKPATLRSLTTTPDSERTVARKPPPGTQASPGELSRGYLSQVSFIGTQLSVYKSILYQASPSYLQSLDEALSATESAAWRSGGRPQGVALRSNLSDYLTYAENKIKIITSAEVPMAGASGPVPVSIQNGLREAVEVRLNVSVVKTPRATSPLTIGRFKEPIIIQPGEASAPVRLPVSSAPQGSTVLQLSLSSADGTPLSVTPVKLTVQSTRYGRAILFLIGAAIGVFVLTSIYRGVRRRLNDDSHAVNEEAGAPGSVVTGTSARHPTEAPDDLADARRWADDA